mmetsp:Transcript_72380/g.205904  ORF Transcript_72380/g.205904 Transcript_72380/m.205904 type:complete len:158 (-) Transcript_72380:73-546(-)
MASYENGAVRHTPHSNGHSNGHSNQVVSNPMVGPNGQEPMRVAFFTASYFVLDGVTLTIRKLLAALKQVCVLAAVGQGLVAVPELGSKRPELGRGCVLGGDNRSTLLPTFDHMISTIPGPFLQAGCETLVITAAPTRDTMGELGALEGENLVLVPVS